MLVKLGCISVSIYNKLQVLSTIHKILSTKNTKETKIVLPNSVVELDVLLLEKN